MPGMYIPSSLVSHGVIEKGESTSLWGSDSWVYWWQVDTLNGEALLKYSNAQLREHLKARTRSPHKVEK